MARLILERPPESRPEGIFAANDLLALGAMQALVAGGVLVPDDIAIVGYDDIEFGEASLIPLTSVRPPHETFGFAAVDLLFEEIAGTDDHVRRRVFDPELVARASSVGGAAWPPSPDHLAS